MFAAENNKIFWSPTLGAFGDGMKKNKDMARCLLDSTACWFEPLSKCESINSAKEALKPRFSVHDKAFEPYSFSGRETDDEGFPKYIPSPYRHKGHFWFVAQHISFIFRPNEKFKQILTGLRTSMQFDAAPRPMLSLHVRHGDSCVGDDKRVCDSLEKYMRVAALPMAEKYGIRSIYLATDDEVVVNETKKWPQFKWIYYPDLNRGELKKVQWEKNLKGGKMDNYAEFQAVLIDIMLLAEVICTIILQFI
jgi:hypothetical protein